MSERKQRWIQLNDPNGAQLKIMPYNKGASHYLVISGVAPRSELFQRLIQEASFVASNTGSLLIRKVRSGELVNPEQFKPFWPEAAAEMMVNKDFILPDPTIVKDKPAARQAESTGSDADSDGVEAQNVENIINSSTYLGWNASGEKVYERASGRFVVTSEDVLIEEQESFPRPMFLRCRTSTDLRQNVAGLLVAVEKGEAVRDSDLERFVKAIWARDLDQLTSEQWMNLSSSLDTLMASTMLSNGINASSCWSDAVYFEQMLPCLATIRAHAVEQTASLPIAVLTHRLLGVLPENSAIQLVGSVAPINYGLFAQPIVAQGQAHESLAAYWSKTQFRLTDSTDDEAQTVNAIIANISDDEAHLQSFLESLDRLPAEQLGVLQLKSKAQPGSLDAVMKQWLVRMENIGVVEQAFDVPNWLTRDGNQDTLTRVLLFRKTNVHRRRDFSQKSALPVADSWDVAKTLVDETLVRMQRPDEGTDDSISLDFLTRADNKLQRPYLAKSRIGPSSTMVPKNIQSSLAYALDALEQEYGEIDEFVSAELGFGDATLAESFSPEQVDAVGLGVRRLLAGRGFILGDETGIGKGRVIGALATWALKNQHPVIFITDRSTLFSDLARDLNDIGEWHRFRPLITNVDGNILNINEGGAVLATATGAADLKKLIASGQSPWDTGANIVFTSYSQLSQENSAKWRWLREHCRDALVIADESHIAAGADSNTAAQITDLVNASWSVIYSSATWSSSAKNLRLYARAFPENMSVSVLADLMSRGGHDFSEIFSGMLAMDGAFVRREHDLSKIEFDVVVDEEHSERNEQITAKVSELLGMMAMLSGEVKHALQRINQETLQVITQANAAFERIRGMVGAQTENEAIQQIEQRKKVIVQSLEHLNDARIQASQLGRSSMSVRVTYVDPEQEDNIDNISTYGLHPIGEIMDVSLVTINEWVTKAQSDLMTIAEFEQAQKKFAATLGNNAGYLFKSSFGTGSAIYQAMRRTMAAVLVDKAVAQAAKAVAENRKPVIVFEETGETFVNQFIDQEVESIRERIAANRSAANPDRLTKALADQLGARARTEDLVQEIRMPVLADMMRGLLMRVGGISVSEPEAIGSVSLAGAAKVRAVKTLHDVPGLDSALIEKFDEGIQKIQEQIDQLPPLPILVADAIRLKLKAAGVNIKEVSGRTYQLDPVDEGDMTGRFRIARRDKSKAEVMKRVADFNNDPDSHGLIINVAAATGLSMHSSPRFANTNQRELIEVQTPESAIHRIQLLGRVNRFDQVIPPRNSILTTGLYAEFRALMMQNRKLQDLSANIRSSRENAAVIDSVPDILNATGDRVCAEFLMENPSIASRLDIDIQRLQNHQKMASLLTQRLVLLAPAAQQTVYDEIVEAYQDALLEQSLEEGGDGSVDWRARTSVTRKAWGAPEELALNSAFDSPVYFNVLEYTEDYQPLNWEAIRGLSIESNKALVADERVRLGGFGSARTPLAMANTRASAEQARGEWVSSMLESLSRAITEDRVQSELDPSGTQPESKLKGLSKLGGRWVAVSAFDPMQRQTQAFACLVSRSGRSAKLYAVADGQADVYYLNLNAAIEVESGEIRGTALQRQKSISCPPGHWLTNKYLQCWVRDYPEIKPLDLSNVIERASRVFEAKKVMALADSGFASVQEALASPVENSVKLVHRRQRFVSSVLPHLVPGQIINIQEGARDIFYFQNKMLVVSVDLPPINRETSLSKWKISVVTPGDTKVQTMSASSLMKMSNFRLEPTGDELGTAERNSIEVHENVFDRFSGDSSYKSFTDSLAMYTPGPRKRTQSVLSGNMFEAEQWARATKMARPIIYSDEHGMKRRAVLIKKSAWGTRQDLNGIDFPIRLANAEMVSDFIQLCNHHYFENLAQGNRDAASDKYVAATSFKAAVDLGRNNEITSDTLIYSPHKSILVIEMHKQEKDKNIRAIRAAFQEDKRQWREQKGEDLLSTETSYPLEFKSRAQRTSSTQSTTYVGIPVPVHQDELSRFVSVVCKALGLQLYVPRNSWRTRPLAEQVEQAYYDRVGQRLEHQRAEKIAAAQKRRQLLQTLDLAFEGDQVELSPEQDELDVVNMLEQVDISISPRISG